MYLPCTTHVHQNKLHLDSGIMLYFTLTTFLLSISGTDGPQSDYSSVHLHSKRADPRSHVFYVSIRQKYFGIVAISPNFYLICSNVGVSFRLSNTSLFATDDGK